MLLFVAEAGDAVLAPAVGAAAGVVVGEVLPGVAAGGVVLADGAPLAVAEVGAPAAPAGSAGDGLDAGALGGVVDGHRVGVCSGGARGSPPRRQGARTLSWSSLRGALARRQSRGPKARRVVLLALDRFAKRLAVTTRDSVVVANHHSMDSIRMSSARDQAWNGQPPGVCGGEPSATSGRCPRPKSLRWSYSGRRKRVRASARVAAVLPWTWSQACTKGPRSQGQTVPWW